MGRGVEVRRVWVTFAHHVATLGKIKPLPVHAMHLVRVVDGIAEDKPCCDTVAVRVGSLGSIPGGLVLACSMCLVISEP